MSGRFLSALLLFGCLGRICVAADVPLNDRMGVATHFARKTPITQHWDPDTVLPLVAGLGVGWIRDEILWKEVETRRGEYHIPDKTRQWVDLANGLGLKIVACFAGGNPLYDDPCDPQAYARAAAYVARELSGKVQTLEILNEPFGYYAAAYGEGVLKGGSWDGLEKDGSPSPWTLRYLALLNAAAEAVKAAAPGIKVVGLGSPAPVNYRLLARGVSPAVDGITDHPYSFRTVPEVVPYLATPATQKRDGFQVADAEGTFASFVQDYRAFSRAHGGPAQLWFTEWGYSTFREGMRKKEPLYSAFSEEAQAKYAQRRFVECLGLGVELSVVYELMDDGPSQGGDPFEPEHHFGLVRQDRSPKPAYAAVQRVARQTAQWTPGNDVAIRITPFSDRTEEHPVKWDGAALPAPRRIWSYPFRDAQGRPVFAVWSAERAGDLAPRAADIELDVDPAKGRVEVLDLLTGDVTVPATTGRDGKLFLDRLEIPDHPIVIQWNPLPPAAESR